MVGSHYDNNLSRSWEASPISVLEFGTLKATSVVSELVTARGLSVCAMKKLEGPAVPSQIVLAQFSDFLHVMTKQGPLKLGEIRATATWTSLKDLRTNTMLSTARSRAVWQLSRRVQLSARRAYAFSANDQQEINTNDKPNDVPNVSKTNELPMETPHRDAPLQEFVEDAESLRVAQAPNRKGVWSRSQNPRAKAMSGPRFEQTIMDAQVCL